MERLPALAPCLVGSGTLTRPRDMVRALETLEGLSFEYDVDGERISEGKAALVKLMADTESATILVNECLFLNVASFRYLTFSSESGSCVFELHAEGAVLRLRPCDDVDTRAEEREQLRMLESGMFDPPTFVVIDDDEDEE